LRCATHSNYFINQVFIIYMHIVAWQLSLPNLKP